MAKDLNANPADLTQAAPGDSAVDQLVAEYGGDPRAAVAALLEVIGTLERDNRKLAAAASTGYVRRTWSIARG